MKKNEINIKAQINKLVEERGISNFQVFDIIKDSINGVYLKNRSVKRNLIIEGDEKKGILKIFEELDVVKVKTEEFCDSEILLEDAKEIEKNIGIGEIIVIPFDFLSFSRFSVVQIKQRIKHSLNILQSEKNYKNFIDKKGKILSGTIENVSFKRILIDVGGARAFIPREELIPFEFYRSGKIIKFYVKEVFVNNQHGQILGSRIDINFLKLLFELEVPEINVGLIKIVKIVHIPGVRAKIAVVSLDETIDPIGSCVGKGGSRILSISNELKNEKIDIFLWDENIEKFLLNVCTPIKVVNFEILNKEEKEVRIIVIKEQYDSISRYNDSWKKLFEEITEFKVQIETLEEFGQTMDKIILNGNLSYEDLENLEINKEILFKCKETE